MPEAEVLVTRETDSLVVAVGKTDSQGVARLISVPAGGPYTVRARKIGYQPVPVLGVHVREGDTLSIPLALHSYTVVLPEVETKGGGFSLLPRFLRRDGFLGIRLFKCLFIGIGDAREPGCTENADAHAARKDAREAASNVKRAARRVTKARNAGRRPDPKDALLVLNTAQTCSKDIPRRPRWPRPDPDVECREMFNRIPRDTLAHLGQMLAAIDSAESFDGELRQRAVAERRRLAEDRASKMTALLVEAETRYVAQEVHAAARRVDLVMKAGQRPDSMDALLMYEAAAACGSDIPEENRLYCRAILKQTSRKTLARLVSMLAAQDSAQQRDTAQVRSGARPASMQ